MSAKVFHLVSSALETFCLVPLNENLLEPPSEEFIKVFDFTSVLCGTSDA